MTMIFKSCSMTRRINFFIMLAVFSILHVTALTPAVPSTFRASPSMDVHAQDRLGSLLYRNLSGRGITLEIISDGLGQATFFIGQGDQEKFRRFVQRQCMRESSLDKSARILTEQPPTAYASGYGRGPLVRTAAMTYWRYGPDLVLPARFKFSGETWELIQASVPARPIKQDSMPGWVS